MTADPNAWRHVNRLQLAALIGVHADTVSDYARGGMPVITRGGAGQESDYDAVECLAWWRAHQGQDAKEVAQTRAYNAQAKLNELKLEVQRKALVPIEDVILAGQGYTKAWVAKIRAFPRQLVQTGLIAREHEEALVTHVHALLIEISQWKMPGDSMRAKKAKATKGPS